MNTGFLGPAVATVLTVYGIETCFKWSKTVINTIVELQQYLPFTVLKLRRTKMIYTQLSLLQQYLPFTVLKPVTNISFNHISVELCCNSTYRLRY